MKFHKLTTLISNNIAYVFKEFLVNSYHWMVQSPIYAYNFICNNFLRNRI